MTVIFSTQCNTLTIHELFSLYYKFPLCYWLLQIGLREDRNIFKSDNLEEIWKILQQSRKEFLDFFLEDTDRLFGQNFEDPQTRTSFIHFLKHNRFYFESEIWAFRRFICVFKCSPRSSTSITFFLTLTRWSMVELHFFINLDCL